MNVCIHTYTLTHTHTYTHTIYIRAMPRAKHRYWLPSSYNSTHVAQQTELHPCPLHIPNYFERSDTRLGLEPDSLAITNAIRNKHLYYAREL